MRVSAWEMRCVRSALARFSRQASPNFVSFLSQSYCEGTPTSSVTSMISRCYAFVRPLPSACYHWLQKDGRQSVCLFLPGCIAAANRRAASATVESDVSRHCLETPEKARLVRLLLFVYVKYELRLTVTLIVTIAWSTHSSLLYLSYARLPIHGRWVVCTPL